ncbi:MAG: hypothetical protein ACAI25_12285 [Planctomycetota bacterium]
MSVQATMRAMTDDERLRARRILRLTPGDTAQEILAAIVTAIFAGFLGGFAGAILLAFATNILGLGFGPWVSHGVGTFALIAAALVLLIAYRSSVLRREEWRPLVEDIASGIVEVLDVEAHVAWSEKDRVPCFLLDVAAEQLLHVKGECLLPLVEAGTFPCRRFLLVRLPATKRLLSVEPRGEPLPVRA